jgi:peptidoglycan/LPS O-acetylase OafA/YrhL
VLLVIVNHAGVPGMAGGYIGVDIFFVISGFVITQLLMRESAKEAGPALSDFYSRRIRRLVPAATLTLVVTGLAARAALGSSVDPKLPGDLRWTSLFAANLRLIHTGSDYFIPGIHPSLITQFWSLAVEEQFYVVYALVAILILRSVDARYRIQALGVTVAAGVLASAWWSAHQTAVNPAHAFYSPLTRFWELGLGCLLALATTNRPIRTVRAERLAAGAGVVLLCVALIKLNPHSPFPGTLAWLPCGAAVLLLWAGRTGPRTPVSRILSTAPLVYIGDISYSLYLWHYLWLKLPEALTPPLTGFGWRLLELAGTFATAVVSYHLIENPIRRSSRLARDRVATVLLLLVCIAAVWLVAGLVGHVAV